MDSTYKVITSQLWNDDSLRMIMEVDGEIKSGMLPQSTKYKPKQAEQILIKKILNQTKDDFMP